MKKILFVALLSLLIVPIFVFAQIQNRGSVVGGGFVLVCGNYQQSLETSMISRGDGEGGYVGVPALFITRLNFTISNEGNETSPSFYLFVYATTND